MAVPERPNDWGYRRGRFPNAEGRCPAGGAALLAGLGMIILVVGTPTPPASAGEPVTSMRLNLVGPPPGYTGGFEEPTCLACHKGFALGLEGTLEFENLPEAYQAGRVYVVTLTLRSTEMQKAGFQASARFSSGDHRGHQAGTLRSLDDRTSIAPFAGDSSIRYVQHAGAGTDVVDQRLAKWTFEWTAPVGTSDPVVFDASANSANGDDSPLGDLIYATSREVRSASSGS